MDLIRLISIDVGHSDRSTVGQCMGTVQASNSTFIEGSRFLLMGYGARYRREIMI